MLLVGLWIARRMTMLSNLVRSVASNTPGLTPYDGRFSRAQNASRSYRGSRYRRARMNQSLRILREDFSRIGEGLFPSS